MKLLLLLLACKWLGQAELSQGWDSVFASQTIELVATEDDSNSPFSWTEGPMWETRHGPAHLLFTDTITGKLLAYLPGDAKPRLLLDSAGGCPISTDDRGKPPWDCPENQAEPGGNGMAAWANGQTVLCQHGARRLASLQSLPEGVTRTKEIISTYDGKRLNGPNDVVAHRSGDLYFTDPMYAFLEKDRFFDHVYTDAKSDTGLAGVYRWSVANKKLQLLEGKLERPNGIAFSSDFSHLYVSECCQGHSETCPKGRARWHVYKVEATNDHDDVILKSLCMVEQQYDDQDGCADGFAVHTSGLLVASCPNGICVVDVTSGRCNPEQHNGIGTPGVVDRLDLGSKTSNVAFGGGYAWITGEALWRIPLSNPTEHGEL